MERGCHANYSPYSMAARQLDVQSTSSKVAIQQDLAAGRDPVAYRDPAMVETEVQLLFGQLPTAQPDWMFWDTRRQGREA